MKRFVGYVIYYGAVLRRFFMSCPSLKSALTAAPLLVLLSLPSMASEVDFLSRFSGAFSGGGLVQRNAGESPNKVSCTLVGQSSDNAASMSGQCGAFIFSRQIRADLHYDPASDRYSGVYVGSAIGPAGLSGKRRGDAVVLTITWPQPVNGDTTATLTIHNPGNGQLAITVTDEVTPGGPSAYITQIALNGG